MRKCVRDLTSREQITQIQVTPHLLESMLLIEIKDHEYSK